MPNVWDPDWLISPDLAKSIIETSFPELAPASIAEFGSGWDNTVFLVNDSFVFRFPRRRIAVPLMETEIRLLPWLSSKLPVPIPNPTHVGAPSPEYPCAFAGYPLIRGRTIPAVKLSVQQRTDLARPLGQFLAVLHSLSPDEARDRGAGEDPFQRLDATRHNARAIGRLDRLSEDVLAQTLKHRIRYLLETLPVLKHPSVKTLVHGDLHGNQILVTEQTHELAGIIDWGDVHLGDPAVDFVVVHSLLPKECHQAFLEEYGPVDSLSWSTAKSQAIRQTIAVLAHAVDVEDTNTILEAQSCLARITEA
jgi:aminoglycoside phosphotransferase (APT) family kinase protein